MCDFTGGKKSNMWFLHIHYPFVPTVMLNVPVSREQVSRNMHVFGFNFVYLLAFDFCPFCVVIRFFHPRHNGQ